MNYYVYTSFLKAFLQAAGYLNQDSLGYWQEYPSIILRFSNLKTTLGLVVSSPKIQECSWAEAIFTEISSWVHNQTLGEKIESSHDGNTDKDS